MRIPQAVRKGMVEHLTACLPEEGCGLLAGRGGAGWEIFPMENELHSPTAFRMNPQDQLQAFLQIEDGNLELVAIFHSHPHGPQIPSPTDLAESAYPDAVSIIAVPMDGDWIMRGFKLNDRQFKEITLIWE